MPSFGLLDLLLYGLATEHLSRLVTKDLVTSVLRSPFTGFEGTAGEGEVNKAAKGHGTRHAVGELLTCPSAPRSGLQQDLSQVRWAPQNSRRPSCR